MFISLIRLAKPDSEIHLVRSFLFSQLFEGLTVSSSSRFQPDDERSLAHQTSARSPCRLFQSNLDGWFDHWLSFGIVQPAMQSASQATAKTAILVRRCGFDLRLEISFESSHLFLQQ